MTGDGQRPGDDLDRSASAAAHALDATEREEAAAVERAAEGSVAARGELDAFRETAGMLGLAAVPVEPTAELKADLMAKIALTPQDRPDAESTPDVREADHDSESGMPGETTPQADSGLARLGLVDAVPLRADDPLLAFEPERDPEADPTLPADSVPASGTPATASPAEQRAQRRWFSRPAVLLGGVAAAAALLLGGGVVGSAITTSVSDTSAVTASAEQLAAITSAPDSKSARSTMEDGSSATVVWSESMGRSAVLVDGLSALPSDRTYEAWYVGADQVVAAGTFQAGDSTTWHVLDGTMTQGAAIAVTVEPAGGSDQPTSVPILVVESA
ncbi:anti-sigma factor [Cnuibacter sp. UC19_7]|uniref:anti-sigma factor n=1 Tax=Cnuibacter sp. UC19_7 TaxID=3350166 RepID=UPI0036728519